VKERLAQHLALQAFDPEEDDPQVNLFLDWAADLKFDERRTNIWLRSSLPHPSLTWWRSINGLPLREVAQDFIASEIMLGSQKESVQRMNG
jgi:hypothetical protein